MYCDIETSDIIRELIMPEILEICFYISDDEYIVRLVKSDKPIHHDA